MSDYAKWLAEVSEQPPAKKLNQVDPREALRSKTPSASITKPVNDACTEKGTESNPRKMLSTRAFAVEWLRELLQEPRWVEDILRLAAVNGISVTTLKRAKKSVGARSAKMGGHFGGEDTRWVWRLN